MKDPLEKEVERYLTQRLRKRGWLTIKQEMSYRGQTGWPDRVCVSPWGLHVWIELKRLKGRLTAKQLQRIQQLRRRNAFVVVLHGIPDVDAFVSIMDNYAHFRRPA